MPFEKTNTYVHIMCPCLFEFKRQNVSCLDYTLVGAIMERTLVQITLLGLLLALATALPNKVRLHNLYECIYINAD